MKLIDFLQKCTLNEMASFIYKYSCVLRLNKEEIKGMLDSEIGDERDFQKFLHSIKGGVPDNVAFLPNVTFTHDEVEQAFVKVINTLNFRPKSLPVEVNIYRKNIQLIIHAYFKMNELIKKIMAENERYSSIEHDRAYKKWTPEEDEALINVICGEEYNIHQLSAMFGRSPTAIKNHVTELVGVKKVSQEVVGRFIGKINDKEIDGDIIGTLYKK